MKKVLSGVWLDYRRGEKRVSKTFSIYRMGGEIHQWRNVLILRLWKRANLREPACLASNFFISVYQSPCLPPCQDPPLRLSQRAEVL
jgi:hypothetical protein